MNTKVDAITIEVMKNAFLSIAEEMGATLIRTALSTNIKDRMDCSTALYTPDGKLVAQAEHIPLHLGLMPSVVAEVLKMYPPDVLKEGDAILINDPYISGSHLPDIFMISPVFLEGDLIALAADIAHHSDVGGIAPGSISVKATEIFQEGLRIPGYRIRKEGVLDEEFFRLLKKNVRTGEEVMGDIYAQLAANNIAEARLKELFSRNGLEFTRLCMEEIMNYSDRRLRAAITNVPDGAYSFEDYLEGDGITEDLIKIAIKVEIKGDEVTVDFEGTSPQVQGPVNSTSGVTRASVYYVIKSLFDSEVPPNDGAYRAIKVITPKRTVVNPEFPAPVSNANSNTAQRIADTIIGALASVLPEEVMAACSGTMNVFAIGGMDERTHEYFSYVETYGGGQGGMLGLDGMDGVHTNMTNTLNTPVEVMEQTFPLFVKSYSLVNGSGGVGKFRGGMGLTREVVIESDNSTVTLVTDRQKIKPWGLFGGGEGAPSECIVISPNGEETKLPSKITLKVQKGSTIILKTAGGGGYMPASERDPLKVEQDILAGNITKGRKRFQ